MEFKTYRYADVSTVHITPKDAELLAVKDGNPLVVHDYPEGAFVMIPEDKKTFFETIRQLEGFGYSEALYDILREAFYAEIFCVRFDADGWEYGELPTHEW